MLLGEKKVKFNYKAILLVMIIISFYQSVNSSSTIISSTASFLMLAISSVSYLFFTRGKKLDTFSLIFILLFVLGQFVGFFYSHMTNNPNNKYLSILYFFVLFLFLFEYPSRYFVCEECVDNLLEAYQYFAVVMSLYALVFQLNRNIFDFRNESGFNLSNNWSSLFGHRNSFALMLVFGIFSTIFLLIKEKSKRNYFFLLLLSFCLILTFSRASYLAVIVAILVYVLLQSRKNIKLFLLYLFGVGSALLVYLKIPSVKYIVETYMIRQNQGLTGRNTLWEKAETYLSGLPLLFGRGIDAERILLQGDAVSSGTGFHNIILKTLVDGGVFFSILLLILFIRTLIIINKGKNSKVKYFSISVFFGFFAYLNFEPAFILKPYWTSLGISLFMFTIPILIVEPEEKSTSRLA